MRELLAVVFCHTDIKVFEEDTVKVFRAVHVASGALRGRNYRLAVFLQVVFVYRYFNAVTTKAVDSVHEHNIPLCGGAVFEQLLERRALVVATGEVLVLVCTDYLQIVCGCKLVALGELPLDRLVRLRAAGAVPRIYDGLPHITPCPP